MSRVLVIGCGGVASVAIQKCCQASEVFQELCIASRTKAKCDSLAEKLSKKQKPELPLHRLMPMTFSRLSILSMTISPIW